MQTSKYSIQNSAYFLTNKDYSNIKQWLDKTKTNYHPLPLLSPQYDYHPLNYLITIKKINLQQEFISKYARNINTTVNNGLNIFACIFSESKQIYITKPYENKQIFCQIDHQNCTISITNEITLAFFTLDQRLPQSQNKIGANLKDFIFVINLQLISKDGERFSLGTLQYKLNERLKIAICDIQLVRNTKEKAGFVECQIDTPQRFNLSYFIPANCIIDQSTLVSPWKQTHLKQKIPPYIMLPSFPISLQNISISINNYPKLLSTLHLCNPYFNSHKDTVKMQIIKITMTIGTHNSYMLLTDLPNLKDKQKLKQSLQTGNKSKAIKLDNESKIIENQHISQIKKLQKHGQQNITFKISQDIQNNSNLYNPSNQLNLLYFQSKNSQIICILHATVKYQLTSNILINNKNQEKIYKHTLFWCPITFNTSSEISDVQMPMIQHIHLPGYPIQWASKSMSEGQVQAQMTYRCINNNEELHKHVRKERMKAHGAVVNGSAGLKSFGSLKSMQSFDKGQDISRPNQMLRDLQIEQQSKKIITTSQNQLKNFSFYHSEIGNQQKQQPQSIQISKLLIKLSNTLKQRLKLQQCPQIQPEIPNPNINLQAINLIGKSFQLSLRMRQFLPMTNNTSKYYIPRKMEIKILAFRSIYKTIVLVNKQSVKAGIPIQLQNPHRLDYQGFNFIFDIDITEDDAGAFESGNCINIIIEDLQNMQFYCSGTYPSIKLFNIQNQQTITNFKIPLFSQPQSQSKPYKSFYGYLLFDLTLSPKIKQPTNSVIKATQIKVENLTKNMSTRQRQILRINAFQGKDQTNEIKRNLITKHQQSNKRSYVSQITNKQLNNTLEMNIQIGKTCYGWISIQNTDKSDNNLFTFQLDCDYVEIILEKTIYQKQALIQAKKEDNGKWKNIPNLIYITNKQNQKDYYQGKIPQGTHIDLLIKVLWNQWTIKTQDVIIVNLILKRNTFQYKHCKIRLNIKKPLIDKVHHISAILFPNDQNINFKLPQQIYQQNNDVIDIKISNPTINISTLSPNTLYNPKQQSLTIIKINQTNISQTGSIFHVLLGIYFDKKNENLKSIILLQVECLLGQKVNLFLGNLQQIPIPILNQNLKMNDKIFRIESSNTQYILQNNFQRLSIYSHNLKTQPTLNIRVLFPMIEDLIISLITLQGILIKKYAYQIECKFPPRCKLEKIQINAFLNEKIFLSFYNPYQIDQQFFLSSSSPSITWKDTKLSLNQQTNQQTVKIKSKSYIKIMAQVISPINQQIYLVLSDHLHRVVSINQVKIKKKNENKQNVQQTNEVHPYRFTTDNWRQQQFIQTGGFYIPNFGSTK